MNELIKDYEEFSRLSSTEELSDEVVFQKISTLDKKYQNSDYHAINFQSILSNIGTEQKSIKILSCVISRLNKGEGKMPTNKFYYDLANTINSMADINSPSMESPSYMEDLIKSDRYREARKYFDKVNHDDPEHCKRAIVNNASILEKYGRNYEVINLYDDALRLAPNFGAALANKAISLKYYSNIKKYYFEICPHKQPALLHEVRSLLQKSLKDETMAEVLGHEGFCHIEKKFKQIDRLLKGEDFFKKRKPLRKISKYRKFILEKNLFLNFDFGYYYNKESLRDSFFPSLIENLDKELSLDSVISKKNRSCFYEFNQVIESYTSSRYIFFQSFNMNRENDGYIDYTYTNDFVKNSTKLGLLKIIFCSLYNCLDKIAHFINYYFKLFEDKDIYFEHLTKEEFRRIIKEKKNFHLLALFSLAMDFQTEMPYSYLRTIRNKITHSYLNIFDDFAFPDDHADHETSEERMIKDVLHLFIIVKSAMMYSIIAVRQDNMNYSTLPMPLTMQNQVYDSVD